ncbi:MAG: hypothetical protein ABFS30_14565 [Pseudomonadota bacterium]
MKNAAFDWRSRRLWHAVGYFLSAAWMIAVLVLTGGNVKAPLFDYIFIVPLGLWIGGLVIASLLKRIFPAAGR